MKMPLKWAKEYTSIICTPQEFADKMTMSGSKVETFINEADSMQKVVIGRINTLSRHEDSDHLWVCQVDVGDEVVQIVTGAQNLKVGDICPVALHGSKLPNGTEIRKGKLRGVLSNGMLCSLPELGLSTHDFPACSEDGIMVLDGEAKLGEDAAKALGLDGIVFEFEITPNRPDCLSVKNLSREVAATFGTAFKETLPAKPNGKEDISTLLNVEIKAEECSRYMAAIVDNVRIQPSPQWMRERLRQCGVRPINNIVDITNYVMLEYGQPMHAFDYSFVEGGKITVRKAFENENIVTLDAVTRPLTNDMLVIADEKGPVAIAGVMGGENSGVYDTTKQIVFEAASFKGSSVRSTSRKLALRTESSTRFEKGLSPDNVKHALYRALELVGELDAGDITYDIIDNYPNPRTAKTIKMCAKPVSKLLGVEVSDAQIEKILTPLGFSITGNTITVPTFRADVTQNCDIAEEVARFIGYNKIPSTAPRGVASAALRPLQVFTRKVSSTMVGFGFWECETFSFYSPKVFDLICLPKNSPLRNPVRISNPLGEDTSVMRTTALPSLLEVSARNWAARNVECALFELATEYLPSDNKEDLPTEIRKLILSAYGGNWDYFSLKGVVEGLLANFGVIDFNIRRNSDGNTYHPGRCAEIYVKIAENPSDEKLLGTFGEIHPVVNATYGIKPIILAAELNLQVLFDAQSKTPQFKQLPKFPASTRDLALVADEEMPAQNIANTIKKAAGNMLEKLTLFDVYTGENIEKGKKSLAYSLVLRDAAATLTDKQADETVNKILKALAELRVSLRS